MAIVTPLSLQFPLPYGSLCSRSYDRVCDEVSHGPQVLLASLQVPLGTEIELPHLVDLLPVSGRDLGGLLAQDVVGQALG